MTIVSVMADRFRRSWPQLDSDKPLRQADRAYLCPLGKALERPYTTDAHFVPYRTPSGRRLNYSALDHGTTVEMTAVVFDVDGAGHAATDEWRADIRQRVVALNEAHPGLFYYETRGGCRFLWAQSEPRIIASLDDAQEWTRDYHVACANLRRRFGIVADTSCSDWQRSFRLPRATRDPKLGPENRPSTGDPHSIGDLYLDATAEDVEAVKRASIVFREKRERDLGSASSSYRGDGLFFWLLRMRGDVGREGVRKGKTFWVCRCPNRAEHTTNTDWTTSTIVVAPDAGQEVGLIRCKHGHCDKRFSVAQWLRFFSDAELCAARERAGISRKKAA